MKSKTPLVLMEQLVMVLAFALAAALCLRCFVSADRISEKNALRDEAVLMAQTAAEAMKGCGGDYEAAAKLLDGQWNGSVLAVHSDGLSLFVIPEDSGNDFLGRARVEVYTREDDELLFALTTAWQEVGGHG